MELLDAAGKVVASGRSDYDGFFLFERVAYGRYTLRLTAESAKIAGVERAIGKVMEIGPDRTVIRLGAIRLVKADRIALAEPDGGERFASALTISRLGRLFIRQGIAASRLAFRRAKLPTCPPDRSEKLAFHRFAGAVEKTRTSTGFRPQRPQRCASTSSATTALVKKQRTGIGGCPG